MAGHNRPTEPRRQSRDRTASVITLLGVANPTLLPAQSSFPEAGVTLRVETVASRENAAMPLPPGTMTKAAPVAPGNWPRLELADPIARHMARAALDLAWQRLGQADCGAVLNWVQ